MNSRRERIHLQRHRRGSRAGGVVPLGGTTLLVLVTLVLAAGHRDTLPIRQAAAEARWSEAATPRETDEAESRPTSPTRPSNQKLCGVIGSRSSTPPTPACECLSVGRHAGLSGEGVQLVRLALLNLPPPTA